MQVESSVLLNEILIPASPELKINRFSEEAACSGICKTGTCETILPK